MGRGAKAFDSEHRIVTAKRGSRAREVPASTLNELACAPAVPRLQLEWTMSHSEDDSIRWAEIEARACAEGALPAPVPAAAEVYRERNLTFNLRKAEALADAADVDPLQGLRTAIARGHILALTEILGRAFAENPALRQDPEWRLEEARLFAFAGEWARCFASASEVLRLDATGITRMTALQSRSLAAYELGESALASKDIDLIRSYAQLYPASQAAFFNDLLVVRVAVQQGRSEMAAKELDRLWANEQWADSLNLMRLLGLLRAGAHVGSASGKSARRLLIAAHAVAEKFGDEQYAAQARTELFASGDSSRALAEEVRADAARFPKIARWVSELEAKAPTSATTRALLASREESAFGWDARPERTEHLLLADQRLLIALEPFAIHRVAKVTRPWQMLEAVARGEAIGKAELFRDVFEQRYAEHLHGPLVRQVLSRVRRQWKVAIESDATTWRSPGVLFVSSRG